MTPEKLRQLRKENKLTQKKLADMLGFSRQATISEMEREIVPITKRTAKLIQFFLTK